MSLAVPLPRRPLLKPQEITEPLVRRATANPNPILTALTDLRIGQVVVVTVVEVSVGLTVVVVTVREKVVAVEDVVVTVLIVVSAGAGVGAAEVVVSVVSVAGRVMTGAAVG